MIYLDNGATSFYKPKQVQQAVNWAMEHCANPGRGGHVPAMKAAEVVYRCREQAGELFDCEPEQVVFTSNCTHGLNIAIHSMIKPGSTVAVTGFEHNAVVRPLYARNVKLMVAGRKLFEWEDTLEQFEKALKKGVSAAVFTHCSNVFGYILPVLTNPNIPEAMHPISINPTKYTLNTLLKKVSTLNNIFVSKYIKY